MKLIDKKMIKKPKNKQIQKIILKNKMGCQMNKRETNSDHEMLIFNCGFCLKILFIRE